MLIINLAFVETFSVFIALVCLSFELCFLRVKDVFGFKSLLSGPWATGDYGGMCS